MIEALDRLGGLLTDGDARHAGGKLDILDPTTGERIAAIATSTAEDCLAAVEAAAAARWSPSRRTHRMRTMTALRSIAACCRASSLEPWPPGRRT